MDNQITISHKFKEGDIVYSTDLCAYMICGMRISIDRSYAYTSDVYYHTTDLTGNLKNINITYTLISSSGYINNVPESELIKNYRCTKEEIIESITSGIFTNLDARRIKSSEKEARDISEKDGECSN